MLTTILNKIGLNEKEAQVYLALLELGSQPASVVGKKAGINRSTTYLVLETLIKRGYVNQHVRADVKYFTAADPKTIVQSLKNKEKELDNNKKELEELLPEFYSLINPLSIKPKVKFYEGEAGIKRAMEDTLTATETIRAWTAYDSWMHASPNLQRFIHEYARLRIEKYKIPVRILVEDVKSVRDFFSKEYPTLSKKKDLLIESRWMPKDILKFKNEINIYNDKVSIVSLAKNELLGVVFESHEIAKTHKAIFDMAWKAGKKS